MVIGILISTIGLIPIVLALSMNSFYKESNLSFGLVFSMVLITFWQFDIGVLYFERFLSKDVILFLFKLFRFSTIFFVPTVFFLAYTIIKSEPTTVKKGNWLGKFLSGLFNNKTLYAVIAWSLFVYVINWTPLGVENLHLHKLYSSIGYYYPSYGFLGWIFKFHVGSSLLFLFFMFVIAQKVKNASARSFLSSLSLYSLFLFASGFLNFYPKIGGISSSIGVVLFSTLIVREYIKLNSNIKSNYYKLLERQSKLDYTGNLSASLIHEIKNTNEITRGFSNMLMKSESLTEKDNSFVEMIHKSSIHLEDLANNYKKYMKSSVVSMKKEDMASIIQESIDFTQEILRVNHVKIEFINGFNPLTAYVNKTNIEQVFVNLIKNSIEAFSPNQENKKITVMTELDEDAILIHFKDTGRGIPKENWESIFDPFMTFKDKGMGLGMPFVKKIIIEHMGNINIVESSAEGTYFKIEIPKSGLLNMN